MKIFLDLETNGLYDTVSELWIAITKDPETDKVITFSDHDKTGESKPLDQLIPYLEKYNTIIGHNLIAYDLPVMHKLLKWEPRKDVKLVDTMLISQLNFYKRPGKHSLGNFGRVLKDAKGDSPAFDHYSEEMKVYGIQDINLTHKVYKYVVNEAQNLIKNRPAFQKALRTEHKIAYICADQTKYKWKFDLVKAQEHYDNLTAQMKVIEDKINPTLKPRKVYIDKVEKTVKYLQDGRFSMVSARMLSEFLGKVVAQEDTKLWPDPKKTFKRFKMVDADLGNMDQVRGMLLDNGWKPTQFTPTGEPKITEDSLESITGDMGKEVLHYYSLRSRHSVLKGWIELANENNGRVYVEAFNIGTATGRQRHSRIVNIPSTNSFFGKEMRELFIADEGRDLVGCDSSSNQMRALAHYLNNKEVTDFILNKDIHTHTAEQLNVPRNVAKSILYATIFGAGFGKLGKMVLGYDDLEKGKEVKTKLYGVYTGLKELMRRLNSFFHTTEYKSGGLGFIPAMDGRKLYCDNSFRLLNYLLQSFEAITVKSAIVNAFEMFNKEKLDVEMRAMVHDEVVVCCAKKDTNRVKEILEYSFGDFITRDLKLNVQMAGEAKSGSNYSEIH